jgi:hypothetical protein
MTYMLAATIGFGHSLQAIRGTCEVVFKSLEAIRAMLDDIYVGLLMINRCTLLISNKQLVF